MHLKTSEVSTVTVHVLYVKDLLLVSKHSTFLHLQIRDPLPVLMNLVKYYKGTDMSIKPSFFIRGWLTH